MNHRSKTIGLLGALSPILAWSLLNAAILEPPVSTDRGATAVAADGIQSSALKSPVVLRRVEPEPPYRLGPGRRNAVSVVRALASADGTVREIVAIDSSGQGVDLNDWNLKVADAVQQWQVKPELRDGQPIETGFNVRVVLSSEDVSD